MHTRRPKTEKIPRGSYRDLKGGVGRWHLRNPKGDREVQAGLVMRHETAGEKFAIFRIF